MMGCAGRTLGELIDHPMFDGSMRITAVHETRSGGFALTLEDAMGPMPAHW